MENPWCWRFLLQFHFLIHRLHLMSRKMSHLLRPPHSFVLQWHFIQNWHPMLRKWKHLAKTTNGRFDVLPLQRSRNSSGDPNHQNSHGRFGRAACPPSTVALKGTCLYRLVAWKHLNKQNPPGGSPTKFPHLGNSKISNPRASNYSSSQDGEHGRTRSKSGELRIWSLPDWAETTWVTNWLWLIYWLHLTTWLRECPFCTFKCLPKTLSIESFVLLLLPMLLPYLVGQRSLRRR